MQNKQKNVKPQKVFVGIDVHLKSWDVTCITETGYTKSFNQPPEAQSLKAYLSKTFPKGEYHAVYESGFSGFSTYYELTEQGIHTIIANAADVPTTQKESVMKTDRRDSKKLAQALKAGEIESIVFVRDVEDLDDRSLVRVRKIFKQEENATKTRIKHMLHTNGIKIPEKFCQRWSKAFVEWIRTEASPLGSTKKAILLLLDHLSVLHAQVLAAGRAVAKMIKSEKYAENLARLLTVPGIGINFAVVLLTEIGDFSRFPNERCFASAIGLVPMCKDSGPKVTSGSITFRGNRMIGAMMIESAWTMVRKDPTMNDYFYLCCQKMKKNKAIVKVARRMSNIILSMMKNKMDYDPSYGNK